MLAAPHWSFLAAVLVHRTPSPSMYPRLKEKKILQLLALIKTRSLVIGCTAAPQASGAIMMQTCAKRNGRIQMQLAQSCRALCCSIACFMCLPGSMTSCNAVMLRAFALQNVGSVCHSLMCISMPGVQRRCSASAGAVLGRFDAQHLRCAPCMLMHIRLQKTKR